jgi:HK97 family phage portal protein
VTVIVSGGRPRSAKSYPFPTAGPGTTVRTPNLLELLRGDGRIATFEGIFRTQPMLHAVVMKLVYGIARNPLKSYTYGDGDSRERDRTSELALLLRRPYPGGSQFKLKAYTALDLHVHGHALNVKVRRNGPGSTPKELWPVRWKFVDPVRDRHENILGYIVNIGGERLPLGVDDVIHYELPGGSPIESLARTLALEDASQEYQANSIRNGITPRAVFSSEQQLNDKVVERVHKEIGAFYAGVDNAGKAMILEMGLKPDEIGKTPVDLALIDQRKLSRDEVCAAYDVAPALLGLERATQASASELRKGLYDSIATKLVLIEETIQAELVDPEPAWDGLFQEFDTWELLRPDPEAQARADMLSQQSSSTTVNERRKARNLPPIDDPIADTVLLPANMTPLGVQAPASAAGTPEQGATDPAFLVSKLTQDAMLGEGA